MDVSGLTPAMNSSSLAIATASKGFLALDEGMKLFELAYSAARLGPCVEIGSYCGKSAVFLAEGCRSAGGHLLFSIDHHRGSEEQQPGAPYFDQDLYDRRRRRIDTLPHFLETVDGAGLQDWIVPVVGASARIAASWPGARLGLLFIDGGHSQHDVDSDYRLWAPLVSRGGYLCFHDVFPNPADGGQAPYLTFSAAQHEPDWDSVGLFGSLGVLQRR